MTNNDLNFGSFNSGPRKRRITGKATISPLPPRDISHLPQNINQFTSTDQSRTLSPSTMVPVVKSSYTSSYEEPLDLDFREYIGVLMHRRYWLIVTVIICLVIGFFTRIDFDPHYSATSRLRVISMTGVMDPWYGYDYVNSNVVTTHMENLKSSRFLKQVAKQLDTNVSGSQLQPLFSVTRTDEANIINILVSTRSPVFSTKLANALADTYDRYDLAIKQKSFRDYENWIREQMDIRKKDLNDYETQIKAFFEAHPEFYTKGKEGNSNIKLYTDELTTANLEISDLSRQEFLVQNELGHIDSSLLKEVTYDKPLQKELLNLRLEQAQLMTKYQPNHPKVRELNQRMKAIQKLIQQDASQESNTMTMVQNPRYQQLKEKSRDIKVQKDLLSSRKREFEKLQETSFKELTMAPDLELQYSQLIRNKQSTEKMFFMLEEKLQETRLKKSATPREVFYMDGTTGRGILVPKKHMGMGASAMLGLMLGFCVCFVIDFFDSTIRKSKDLEAKYGINLLALIPKTGENDRQRLKSLGENELMKPQFEPYRRLLANLFPSGTNYTPTNRSLLVTSALQGEGKTTTAAFLAATSALKGEKVLLVDADLRRHTLHNIMGLENNIGLSDYLNQNVSLESVVQKTNIPNLSMVCAGQDPLSLTQSYAKKKLQQLVEEAGQQYDLLILDSPPILQLTDTLTIAPLVSKTLLVFRSKKTPLKAGEEVVRQLMHIDAHVAGGVLNDVSRSFWDQYYYQYYKYGYKYSYY